MKQILAGCLLVLSIAIANGVALADVVQVMNGDRLSGTVTKIESGKVVLKTDYAGKIEILFDRVQGITTAQPLLVRFQNGLETESRVEIQGDLIQLESAQVHRREVKSIETAPEVQSQIGPLDNWKGSVDFSFNLHRGNTVLQNRGFIVRTQRRTPKDLTSFQYTNLFSKENQKPTSDQQVGRFRFDRFVNPSWFLYGSFAWERDARENLSLRTRQGGGFGYRFSGENQTELAVFGGLAFVQERFETLERQYTSEGTLGVEFSTGILAPVLLTATSNLLPRLSEDRYLYNLETGVRIPLVAGLSFGFQFFDKFDSQPPTASLKNDYGFLSTLGFTF